MKAVVFGGSGFLGSFVCNELHMRGYHVVVADNQEPDNATRCADFIKLDLSDPQNVSDAINGASFVYNYAAIAKLEEANEFPRETFSVNVLGHLNILQASLRAKVKRVIYASSAYALSSSGSFYGISKQTAERLTQEYSDRFGLAFTILRYGSIYGPKPSINNYIYNLLKCALETGKLVYQGRDEDVREYIHVQDAAKLSADIIENTRYEGQRLILTGNERLKRRELIELISEILNKTVIIEHSQVKNFGHYTVTPYTYTPDLGKKITSNEYIDMGQGILECIQMIQQGRIDE